MPEGTSLQKTERRGGYRANAGRKAGGQNAKTRLLADQIREKMEDETPLDVMLQNMHYYHKGSLSLTEKCEELAASLTPQVVVAGGEVVLEFLKMLQKVTDYRVMSQRCAVDAAPYVHPRLAAIEFKEHHDTPAEIINKSSSPKNAALTYGALLDITPAKKEKARA